MIQYFLIVAVALLFIGCQNNPVVVTKNSPYFNVVLSPSTVKNPDSCLIGCLVTAIADPLLMKKDLTVTINNRNPDPDSLLTFPYFGYAYPTFWGWFWQNIHKNQIVNISTPYGIITGSIFFPDTVLIQSPKNNDTIWYDSILTLKWNGNADYYILSCYSDENNIISTKLETTVPLHWVPKNPYSSAEIRITSINGPLPNVASDGNLSGAGQGFLRAQNNAKTIKVYVK